MLTEGAKEFVESAASLIRIGMFLFIGYALTHHYPWSDSVALTLVLILFLRALSARSGSAT